MSNRSKACALLVVRAGAMAFVAIVLLLDLGTWLPLPTSGPIGLARIFAVHLTLLALACLPLALGRGRAVGVLRVGLATLAIVALIAFGDEWWSSTASAPGDLPGSSLEVATWNLEMDSRSAVATVAALREIRADVIGVQELTPAVAAAITDDAILGARFPYREFVATEDVFGLGILSRHPLSEVVFDPGPSRMTGLVGTPHGDIRVLVVHPLPGRITLGPMDLPVGFEPTARSAALGRIRETLNRVMGAGTPTLVMGDINTAPTEPAFDMLRGGLIDAHRAVGIGPGWTYRPSRLEWMGIGLIRIDVIFTSKGLRPSSIREVCHLAGDHCIVQATLVVTAR